MTSHRFALVVTLAVGCFLGLGARTAAAQVGDQRDKRFVKVSFSGAGFERCSFTRARIEDSTGDYLAIRGLSGYEPLWENLTLSRPKLYNLQLTDADWRGGKLTGRVQGVQAPGVKLYRCHARDVDIEYSELRSLSCRHLDLWDLAVYSMQINGARLEHVNARSLRWRDGDLSDAQLERVSLRDARIDNCNLSGARLERCSLRNARLRNCDISGLVIDGYNIEELIRKAKR